ncbi:MAG: cell surface protein SprA [Bacteroidia bacterium]|nr:cell surface protein SprA [Bacteroidia bacterium]
MVAFAVANVTYIIPQDYSAFALEAMVEDTNKTNKPIKLPFPFKDRSYTGNPYEDGYKSKLTMEEPSNVKTEIKYNPTTGNYEVTQKMGDMVYKPTTYYTLEEYKRYDMEKSMRNYYKGKVEAANFNKQKPSLIPKLNVGGEIFDRIFGSNVIDIRPQGTAELTFGVNVSKNANPAIPVRNRKITTFDFNQKIQLSVTGKIGDKFKLSTNYNTEATFDFENITKLEWAGNEDDILQKIEVGNITMPLTSSLITGSQNLFGAKTNLKFGKLNVMAVVSQQKSQKKEVTIPPGGGQLQTFEVKADNYEANKHYFVSQYFYKNYDRALTRLPFVNSQINITRMEVWVTNRTYDVNNRNIAAFMDMGEATPSTTNTLVSNTNAAVYPDNNSNNLLSVLNAYPSVRDYSQILNNNGLNAGFFKNKNFTLTKDYDITVAKKLQPNEYTFSAKLGFISLNQSLNADEVLAVAYQYTIDGKTYQVGEFSTDGIDAPKVLYLKLLKSTLTNVHLPTWDLMMKNIYSLGAFQIQKDGFRLDILQTDVRKNIDFNYINAGAAKDTPLVRVLGLDKLNAQLDPAPDGVFDVIDGVTINMEKGRIYFPSVEPFGNYIAKKISGTTVLNEVSSPYVFQQLYDSTKFAAQQFPNLNRYKIKGVYKSSSGADISLNALNIPQGSVSVTAGGILLKENVDYTVDYTIGRVKIINDAILNSGQQIKASFENNSLFSVTQKSLWGTHMDYNFSKDFVLGGTFLHATERPLTQKINIGDEPISNSIYGFNANYSKEAPWLTRLVDKLPLYSTKDASNITASGEFAQLIPGQSKAIRGNSYIDDFEGSQSSIDLRNQNSWSLASVPQNQPALFSEAALDSTYSGFRRAKLAWYVIDPLFYRNDGTTPEHIKNDKAMQSNHYMRSVQETEIFPNKSLTPTQQLTNLQVLDLSYFPEERGPYNFSTNGLGVDGRFANPRNNWAGIQRRLETTDFENANIQYIQVWMMDPFDVKAYQGAHGANTTPPTEGYLNFNLGDVSEDVLKDNKLFYENGLPVTTAEQATNITDTSAWGVVPTRQIINNAFDNDPNSRVFQDVGYDGVNNEEEKTLNAKYLSKLQTTYGPTSKPYLNAEQDPASDNYNYYRDNNYDTAKASIITRYKKFNSPDGNSKINASGDAYPTQATTQPNSEDINKDNTLNRNEAYYQYRIKINPADMVVGKNYITNKVLGQGKTIDGNTIDVHWYQFKIPVREPQQTVGNISDYRSIRFIRMFMNGFDKPTTLRFGRLELLRGDWRKYAKNQYAQGEYVSNDVEPNETQFNIGAVNLEENGKRDGINYMLPPGIQRQTLNNTNVQVQLNEQALSLGVCNLQDGDERAAFKSTEFDIRMYKTLKMYMHAENKLTTNATPDGTLTGFVRLGTDFDQNYYEYELPLKFTTPNATGTPGVNDPALIWPTENNIDLQFEELQNAKLKRNTAYANNSADFIRPYTINADKEQEGINVKRKITVVGNPNIANLKIVMIGIRNPKKQNATDGDDGQPVCADVWANELRLSDFDNISGWAALARVQAKLADLGTVSAAANMSTPGFGGLDQRLNERYKETTKKYDLSGNFALDKFLPKTWNLRVPIYMGFSEQFITPRFNPLDPDITYKKTLDNLTTQGERDTFEIRTQDYTRRRSLNFTNVKKEKGKNSKKAHVYDVENWAATYAFTDMSHRDINLEFQNSFTQKASLNYGFSPAKPLKLEPFAKTTSKFMKRPSMKIIKDLNLGLAPKRLGFRVDLDRQYSEQQFRNNADFNQIIIPTYFKNFIMNRTYDYAHDITKALEFTFNATNASRIDEPNTRYHKPTASEQTADTTLGKVVYAKSLNTYNKYRDSVLTNIKTGGRNTSYKHTASLNYTVPINKIPMFNWVTSTTRYSGNYDWTAASTAYVDSTGKSLGNTIQNSNSKQANLTMNMVGLFNKFPYYKKITSPPKPAPKKNEIDAKIKLYKDSLQTKEKHLLRLDKLLTKAKKKKETENIFAIKDSTRKDKKRIKIYNRKLDSLERALQVNAPNPVLASITKFVLSMKNASASYTESNGTLLPGYNSRNHLLGMNGDISAPSPGWEFISGWQNRDIAQKAGEAGWLVKSSEVNTQYTFNTTKNLNLRTNLEPIKNVKIDLTASRQSSLNHTELYRWTGTDYASLSPIDNGTFSISTITIKTAFKKNEKQTYKNEVFDEFLSNRVKVSNQFGTVKDSAGYTVGYGKTSQDVMIPALLAAYTGADANGVATTAFPKIPLPNWRVSYDGLSRLPLFKDLFKSITLNHSYKSTYSVGSYTGNLNYNQSNNQLDRNNNFNTENIINNITILESFSPLLGTDVTWINGVTTKFEMKRDRNLNMNFANTQLTEIQSKEIVIGGGYRFKDVKLDFNFQGTKTTLKSDINLRADLSIRNNKTIIRKASDASNQLTAGQNVTTIKFTADYAINQNLVIQAFYDRNVNNPFVSTSFKTANTQAGVKIRFTLAP